MRCRSLLVWILCLATLPAGATPPPERAPAAILMRAIRDLGREARAARTEGRLPRASADYAGAIGAALPAELVLSRLRRPADGDPAVDAYIRWQLTGFVEAPAFATQDDFESFVAALPPLVENPRARRDVVDLANRAIAEGSALTGQDASLVAERLDAVAAEATRAQELNRPALELRAWLAAAQPDTGLRALQVALERCSALVAAGWPVDREKGRLDELVAAAAPTASLTREDRDRIASQMRRFEGTARVYVAGARLGEGVASVDFRDTGVYDFEVSRWVRLLQRTAPEAAP